MCQVDDGGPALAPETARRLACDQPVVVATTNSVGHIADAGRRTRRINRRLKRALRDRDHGCRYPGCTAQRTDAHHIIHWADGGATTMANLVSLCPTHHHRHHEGHYRIATGPSGELRFIRSDGRPVPDRSRRRSGTTVRLPAASDAHSCNWDGDRLDLRACLDALHPMRDSAESPQTGPVTLVGTGAQLTG